MPALFEPFKLGPVTIPNRIIKAATFEGMTPDAAPSRALLTYHRMHAVGGVGLTTVSYCSASSEGRTYRHQMWMRQQIVPALRVMTDALHDQGTAVGLQLGHAGWFANPKATREPNLGPSRKFSPYALAFSKALTESDLRRLVDDYASSARLACDAGFDAIEVHVGHGYLLSQFLSPWTNRRRDQWGGSLDNRARFPREVLVAVKEAVGDRAAVWAKLNMEDGFKGGLTLDEGIEVARMIDRDGSVDAIQPTVGFTARTPMWLLRGDVPLKQMVELERDRVRRTGMRMFAPFLMHTHPFTEAYLKPMTDRVREAVTTPVMLLGGVTRKDTAERAVADGYVAVAMARALLAEPDLPNRWQAGDESAGSRCIHCNACVTEMDRQGTRCVLDPVPDHLPATAGDLG